jgi:CheY-like chemotaxis protein
MKNIFKKLSGKIILIDDAGYEKGLLEKALIQRRWDIKVEYFTDAESALEYLKNTQDEIFLIISDMNLPRMSGLELKMLIDKGADGLREKLIPFIFLSNTATKEELTKAYTYRVQGYFKKPIEVDAQASMLDTIIRYWILCRHPNKVDYDTKYSSYCTDPITIEAERKQLAK